VPDDADRLWVGSMPDAYDRFLGPVVFRPFAEDLAARVAPLKPRRALELAAGTGQLTRELSRTLAETELIATDRNDAMVRYGADQVPAARWERADAQQLSFPDESFDLIVCQFGVMFFPDKRAAFAEARRVLAPEGRLVFSTWDSVEKHDFSRALVAGLEQAFPADPPRFVVAVPHGYADPAAVEADLVAAGFNCEATQSVTLEGVGSAADVATGFCTGTPLRAEIEARADLEETTEFIAERMTAQLGAGPVRGRMAAYVFHVGKPGASR
jgi:SAM-dependent methyltransferase